MYDKTKVAEILAPYRDTLKKYLLWLRDVRNVGTAVFVVIVMLISWSSAKVIQTNYVLERQVRQTSKENEVRRLQNENLKLQNQYYGTPQYREITARQNYGLAKPGETVIIVPRDVALRYVAAQPKSASNRQSMSNKIPAWQRNADSWMNFFLNRHAS